MNPKYIPVILLAVLIVISACGPGLSTPDAAATLSPQYTAAALTLSAALTQVEPSATPFPTFTVPPSGESETPLPTNTLMPVPTLATTPAPTLTNTPIPTVASATPVTRCDQVRFEKDVTYPDGSELLPGQKFTKTWRLRNIGTCTWTTAYSLVFVNGDQMAGPNSQALTTAVAPGDTVDISVNLTAPTTDGKYRGNWKLRNANGVLFGYGNDASSAFWVDIKVSSEASLVYDFAANYCDATWRNSSTKLACPGKESDTKGYVLLLKKPVFEGGYKDDEPALLTFPQNIKNGVIEGKFPAVTISKDDHFKALLMCQNDASKCKVVFRLDYQIGNGQVKTLDEWKEVYDGKFTTVDIDLSAFAGQKVKFILVVHADGAFTDDYAMWFTPRIVQVKYLTPTPTPTKKP